jgi:hypothetical protein
MTSIPEPTVVRIVDRLIHDGWLHRVERPESAISLAKPPEHMEASEFIQMGFEMLDDGGPGRSSVLARRLRKAQQEVTEGITLASLLSARPAVTSGGS